MASIPDPNKPIATTWSETLRGHVLAKSGGWLCDLTTTINSMTGVWEVVILAILFIVSWVWVRTSDRIAALILARVYDTTIPLQYQLSENKNVKGQHAKHLTGYWAVFTVATAGEVACYFLLHDDLFTLITCFKTTLMLAFWLGRNADKSFWTVAGVQKADGSVVAQPSSRKPSSSQRPSASSSKLPISVAEYNELQQILTNYSDKAGVRSYLIEGLVKDVKYKDAAQRKEKAKKIAAMPSDQRQKIAESTEKKIKAKGWKAKRPGGA